MQETLKVVLIGFNFGEYCIRLAGGMAPEARVRLLVAEETAAAHQGKLQPNVEFLPFDRPRYRQPLRQLRLVCRLLRQIHAFAPDLVHLQQGHLWFNCALPALRRYPLVLTCHDPRHHVGDRESQKVPQGVLDYGFRRAARVIVHGKRLKQELVHRLKLPESIVHVVPTITRGDGVEGPAPAEPRPMVLFFGRIWEYKGLDYLIRAQPLVSARVPATQFVIAGRGEDFGRYRSLMREPERFVVHNEYVSEQKRAELFRQASVVVLPYVDASQSGVIPMAYTHGKPVVATTVGALPDLVEHGRTGYLVAPRDEVALADALVRLLQDPELRRRFGANGKDKIEAECSPRVVARQTLSVYRMALGAS